MEILENHTSGALLFSFLLTLAVFWIAWRNHFFRLPIPSLVCPVSLKQTIGAFLIYFIFAFILMPLIFWIYMRSDANNTLHLSPHALGWFQVGSLYVMFVLFVIYCFVIRKGTRRFIFWGEGNRSFDRFMKSIGMGVLGWVASIPFVMFVHFLAGVISVWIWGKIEVEQEAVRQLKQTMDRPLLFAFTIFAVVGLIPFMEELLFRGFLQNLLKRYFGRGWAIFVTAVIFSLAHFAQAQGEGNFQLILSLFALALFLGFLYERQRSLWTPIALHVTFNTLSTFMISFFS